MSTAIVFTTAPHRPTAVATAMRNVSGSPQSDNVTYVNFSPAIFPRTRLRLTKRGRRVIVALVALPIVIAAFTLALNGGGATASDQASATTLAQVSATTFSYVTVGAGQTLWQLAQSLAPTADPRDVIDQIVSLNQIHGEIQQGQRLAIPAGY